MSYFSYNDGGRSEAGFKSQSDCAIRAMSIACGIPYKEARQIIKRSTKLGKQGNGNLSSGVYKEDLDHALQHLGWVWYKAPKFEGRKAYYRDMPSGVVIARMAKHFVAIKDNVIYDTWDSSSKMIYGYWRKEQ